MVASGSFHGNTIQLSMQVVCTRCFHIAKVVTSTGINSNTSGIKQGAVKVVYCAMRRECHARWGLRIVGDSQLWDPRYGFPIRIRLTVAGAAAAGVAGYYSDRIIIIIKVFWL